MKAKLITDILRLKPAGAWESKGEYIGNEKWISPFGDWTYPYRKYVNYSSKIIGTTGGPSEATIRDTKFTWNKTALLKASNEELLALKEATAKENNIWEALCNKYDGMNILEFLSSVGGVSDTKTI